MRTNPANPASTQDREIQKQISMFVPLSQWKAIRLEAAKQKIPITELCRRWMRPGLGKLLSELSTDKSTTPFPTCKSSR